MTVIVQRGHSQGTMIKCKSDSVFTLYNSVTGFFKNPDSVFNSVGLESFGCNPRSNRITIIAITYSWKTAAFILKSIKKIFPIHKPRFNIACNHEVCFFPGNQQQANINPIQSDDSSRTVPPDLRHPKSDDPAPF